MDERKNERKKRVYRLSMRRDEKEPVVQLDFPRLSSTNDGGKIEKEQRSFSVSRKRSGILASSISNAILETFENDYRALHKYDGKEITRSLRD